LEHGDAGRVGRRRRGPGVDRSLLRARRGQAAADRARGAVPGGDAGSSQATIDGRAVTAGSEPGDPPGPAGAEPSPSTSTAASAGDGSPRRPPIGAPTPGSGDPWPCVLPQPQSPHGLAPRPP